MVERLELMESAAFIVGSFSATFDVPVMGAKRVLVWFIQVGVS